MAGFAAGLAAFVVIGGPCALAQITCRTGANGVQSCTNEASQASLSRKSGFSHTHAASRTAAHAEEASARQESVSRAWLRGIVGETAAQYGLDPLLVQAVVRVESAWNPAAVSPKDAMGLMQLIPATAHRFNVRNVFNPVENVQGGVRYLAELLSRYQGDLPTALAAYYSGEHTVDRAGGVPSNNEIRAYVRQVIGLYRAETNGQGVIVAVIHRFVDNEGRIVYTNE